MHDETLKKIALTGTIIGLLGLFSIAAFFQEDELAINKIKLDDDGKKVSTTGRVVDVRSLEEVTILTLERSEKIEVLVSSPIDISAGETIRVRGKIDTYQGKKEIIADEIHRVDSQNAQARD